MKVLLISFLSFFMSMFVPLSNEQTTKKDEFIQTCNNGYKSYYVLTEEETNHYYLQIVCGEYENEVSYSLVFITSTPNEYSITMKQKGSSRTVSLPSDSRGDVVVYNLIISKDVMLEIGIKGQTTFSYAINNIDLTQYQLNTNTIKGNNQGLPTTQVKAFTNSELTYILSIIFSIIIIVSIIIILVLYSTKKGKFNQETIDKEFEEQHQMRDHIQSIIKEKEQAFEVECEEVEEEEPAKEVYQKFKDYEDEERDISLLLKEKGFNTNYNTLLTHEKNEIMLELMRMKDFKEITEEEYKKEIIKLWM